MFHYSPVRLPLAWNGVSHCLFIAVVFLPPHTSRHLPLCLIDFSARGGAWAGYLSGGGRNPGVGGVEQLVGCNGRPAYTLRGFRPAVGNKLGCDGMGWDDNGIGRMVFFIR